ncbi:MAG: insulinase family protein, partial [Deltaproteobacteria bacterium]|nr:insulinase family protein [Deltaproteobacteria bacterium]
MCVLPAQAAELTRLANGLSVLVIKDDRFPLVSTRLYVHAGAAFESKGEEGISHLLEHMVFKGTPSRPAGAV